MSFSHVETDILLESGTNELEILEFYIYETNAKGETVQNYFGINVAKVMQVIESPNLEPPESAPHPSFMGTIPLRDMILPVLDLSVWLQIDMPKNERDIVVVTEFSQTVTGFLVSGVTEIHRVGWGEVIPPSGAIAMSTDSIVGIVDKDDHFIQLLDLETILSEVMQDMGTTTDIRAEGDYTALVADDSATIRTIMQNNLDAAGFGYHVTNNGKEAMVFLSKLVEQMEKDGSDITDHINIVISDIEMPLMDGFSLTKYIKQHPALQKLPVILYSSIITDALRHKGEFVGADCQVSKPDMDKIAQTAIDLIEGRKL